MTDTTIPRKDGSNLAYLLGVQDDNAAAKLIAYQYPAYGAWTTVWDALDSLAGDISTLTTSCSTTSGGVPILFDFFMETKALVDGVRGDLTGAWWATNQAKLYSIRVTTTSTDWTLTLYCDSDEVSGLFQTYTVIDHGNGSLEQALDDLVYEDNDQNQAVHLTFVDHVGAAGATVNVYATV